MVLVDFGRGVQFYIKRNGISVRMKARIHFIACHCLDTVLTKLLDSILARSLSSSNSTFSQTWEEECISEEVRIGSVVISPLSEVREAKFFILLCGAIFLVRLHAGILKLISQSLKSRVDCSVTKSWIIVN